jgi:hypothetical protein
MLRLVPVKQPPTGPLKDERAFQVPVVLERAPHVEPRIAIHRLELGLKLVIEQLSSMLTQETEKLSRRSN